MDGAKFLFCSSQGIIELKRHKHLYGNLKFKMKNPKPQSKIQNRWTSFGLLSKEEILEF
jgi:hypothetical protein